MEEKLGLYVEILILNDLSFGRYLRQCHLPPSKAFTSAERVIREKRENQDGTQLCKSQQLIQKGQP